MRLSPDMEKLQVFLREGGPRIPRFMLCVSRLPEEYKKFWMPAEMTSGTLTFSQHAYSRLDSGYTLTGQSTAFPGFLVAWEMASRNCFRVQRLFGSWCGGQPTRTGHAGWHNPRH